MQLLGLTASSIELDLRFHTDEEEREHRTEDDRLCLTAELSCSHNNAAWDHIAFGWLKILRPKIK